MKWKFVTNPVTSFSRQKPLKSKNKNTYDCLEYINTRIFFSFYLTLKRIKAAAELK